MSVTKKQAESIAIQVVTDDGYPDLLPGGGPLAQKTLVRSTEDGNWEVSFPFKSHDVLGGSPYVLISKKGTPDLSSVVEVFYTQ